VVVGLVPGFSAERHREQRSKGQRLDVGLPLPWLARTCPSSRLLVLCLPSGGVLVMPDAVLPFNWTHVSLPGPTGWQWVYLDRWDTLRTWPELPNDMVRW